MTPRILAFAGSARRESFNRKLLTAAIAATGEAGGEVTLVDLNEYAMPIYHGDLEDAHGLPENAQRLVALILEHHGLLIASPEYNVAMSPLLKNTIDWCTRPDENPFIGKTAAVISASPGIYGGVRSAQMVRALLLHLGCHVIPAQCSLSRADEAFDTQGRLTDGRAQKNLTRVASELIRVTRALAEAK